MSKPKLTKWFDGSKFVPAHVGVYERVTLGKRKYYSYWNGLYWGFCFDEITHAMFFKDSKSVAQCIKWRGLAVKP